MGACCSARCCCCHGDAVSREEHLAAEAALLDRGLEWWHSVKPDVPVAYSVSDVPIASASEHSLYIGRLPDDLPENATFAGLRDHLKEREDALAIGLRDAQTGDDQINPPTDLVVPEGSAVIYLAAEPVLPSV